MRKSTEDTASVVFVPCCGAKDSPLIRKSTLGIIVLARSVAEVLGRFEVPSEASAVGLFGELTSEDGFMWKSTEDTASVVFVVVPDRVSGRALDFRFRREQDRFHNPKAVRATSVKRTQPPMRFP